MSPLFDRRVIDIQLQNAQILFDTIFFRSCRLECIWLPVVLCAYVPHVPRGQICSNFRRIKQTIQDKSSDRIDHIVTFNELFCAVNKNC